VALATHFFETVLAALHSGPGIGAGLDDVKTRRLGVRGLFDEQIGWEPICGEFPSKPGFNYQIVKPMNGPGAFCLLFGGSKSRLPAG